MDAPLGSGATEGDVGLLLDLGVEREEGLRHVVVEGARLTVVLGRDRDKGADLLGCGHAFAHLSRVTSHNTRVVSETLSAGLGFIDSLLDREVVARLISGLVTPVGSVLFSLLALFFLRLARPVILPDDSATKEVPIELTIDGHK